MNPAFGDRFMRKRISHLVRWIAEMGMWLEAKKFVSLDHIECQC